MRIGAWALCVFFLSVHSLAQTLAPEQLSTTGYQDGFFIRTTDGNYMLKIGSHFQARSWIEFDAKSVKARPMYMPLARIRFSGNVLNQKLTYFILLDFGSGDNRDDDQHALDIKDVYVDYAFIPNQLQVRVGRVRSLLFRHELGSNAAYQMIDSQFLGQNFYLGRWTGAFLHNGTQSPLEWGAGVFEQGAFGRIGFNYNNPNGYDEEDFRNAGFRYAVALAGLIDTPFFGFPKEESRLRLNGYRIGVDGIVKYEGLSVSAAVYGMFKPATTGNRERNLPSGYVFGGYRLDNDVEPNFRYLFAQEGAKRTPLSSVKHELLAGVNYYFWKNYLKFQFHAGAHIDEVVANGIALAQVQMAF